MRFTVLTDIHSPIHAHIHPATAEHRGTASSSGAIRVRRLAQGHHHTLLGGAGDRTSNLAVASEPALPTELMCLISCRTYGVCLKKE